MGPSKRINFDEPIPQMIERLKSEHAIFESELVEVEHNIKNNDVKEAAEIIQDMSDRITRHAVEEEARLMRVIMRKAKTESSESIKIMQEHNWVVDFLKGNLSFIERARLNNLSSSSGSKVFKDAKMNIKEFVLNLRNHFLEEEQIVFPLVIRLAETN